MSIRDFAAHLGISPRVISRWEAGAGDITPRPVNQAALDTSLARSEPDVHTRFAAILNEGPQLAPAATLHITDGTNPHQIRHPVDGKLMAHVPAGPFPSGPNNDSVALAEYYLDVHPTSNFDYSRFVAATGHRTPHHWTDGLCPADLGNHPVVFVTWHDAHAYAEWAGKALPTAQQWEKAARGPNGCTYPWGNQPTPAKCNVRDSGPGTTTPVDRYQSGISPYGIYDLCGNTWEWCATATSPGRHELKGSAFTSPFARSAPAIFNDADATMYDDDTSFRCIALSKP